MREKEKSPKPSGTGSGDQGLNVHENGTNIAESLPEVNKSGYWAVIPAPVRYDDAICANAKLLYAEISCLVHRDGYCWATNEHFANLYGWTPRSVARMLQSLAERGYITITNGNSKLRRIYAGVNPFTGLNYDKNVMVESDILPSNHDKNVMVTMTKLSDNHDKNVIQNKKDNNKYNIYNNNIRRSSAECAPERFERLWKFYPKEYRGHKVDARKAWDKLQPDDATIDRMAVGLKLDMATDMWKRGIGIPNLCRYISKRMWEDAIETAEESAAEYDSGGWAADPEVMPYA